MRSIFLINKRGVYLNTIQSQKKPNRIWTAIILGTLAAIGPLCIDLYLPALPQIAGDLQTTPSLVQLSLTACLLGLALGQILIGPNSDAFGRQVPLVISLIVFAVASFLCAMAPSIWILIVLRFIQGLAGAGGIVISRAIVSDLYSGAELTKFFALLMLVNGVAPIVAPIVGGQLTKVTNWPGVFIIIGVFSIMMLVAVTFGLKESLPKNKRTKGGLGDTFIIFRSLWSNRNFMGHFLTQGFVMSGLFGYISASPFVLQNIYGASPEMFSFCFAINGVGIIIASQITGRLIGTFSESQLLIFGLTLSFVASSVLLMMIFIKAGLIYILIPLFVVVSCIGITMTTSFSLAIQSQGKVAGSASALLGFIAFVAGAIVAPIVGIGGSHTALPMGLVILVSTIAALICYVKLVHMSQDDELEEGYSLEESEKF